MLIITERETSRVHSIMCYLKANDAMQIPTKRIVIEIMLCKGTNTAAVIKRIYYMRSFKFIILFIYGPP